MEAEFWHDRWQRKKLGFTEKAVNPGLQKHFARLQVAAGAHVFVPLCGKSLDLLWLLEQGCRVTGIDLSSLASEQFFREQAARPASGVVSDRRGELACHRLEGLTFLVGDFFALTPELLGSVDAIYDRAALVAFPRALRVKYARHLLGLAGRAPQLTLTFEYEQSIVDGPPFAVFAPELEEHYGAAYRLRQVGREPVAGGIKLRAPGDEVAWLMERR